MVCIDACERLRNPLYLNWVSLFSQRKEKKNERKKDALIFVSDKPEQWESKKQ